MTDRELVLAIVDSVEQRGYPPSMRELADKFDRSAPAIHQRLHKLAAAGYLTIEPGQPRAIRVVRIPE